jgi:murein DD-endopeptidase MepM/ murein hydrolase activator NlpD
MGMSNVSFGQKSATKFSKILSFTAVAAVLAGCSGSVDRFADYPSIATNSVSSKDTKTAAVESVQTSPLTGDRVATARPSWQNAPSPNAGYTPPAPTYRQAPQQQAYNAPARTAPAPAPSYAPASNGTITVQPGQTMYSLARANGLTVSQLARANNISAPYTLAVGQRLSVPGAAQPVSPQPTVQRAAAPVPSGPNIASQQSSGAHVVKPGETLYSLGRAYNMHPHDIARANGLSNSTQLSVGQRITIPGAGSSSPIANSAPSRLPQQNLAAQRQPAVSQPAQPQQQAAVQAPQPVQNMQQSAQIESTNTATPFRWPVKGRVISKFGSKPNNTKNEGINIAVPEGTAVRASEAGVVAYAGNELKGYGNLVLIRHQNGWVTAYAHNRDLLVKRGDAVRRGDVIAKAGKTGSVTSPQVHFEIRQGATPVDPMKYLTSQTASN